MSDINAAITSLLKAIADDTAEAKEQGKDGKPFWSLANDVAEAHGVNVDWLVAKHQDDLDRWADGD